MNGIYHGEENTHHNEYLMEDFGMISRLGSLLIEEKHS